MIRLATTLAVLSLVGCASTDYTKYSETQVAIARYKAEAEKARYAVLAEIVKKGDPTASVAAVMSMQMGMGGGNQDQRLEAPRNSGDDALKWASLLLPTAIQGFGIYSNAKVATTQSNNATTTALSTNSTFASIANTGSNNQAAMSSNSNQAIVSVAGGATTALSNMANSSNTALTSMAATNNTNVTNALNAQSQAYNTLISTDLNVLNNAVYKLTTAPVVIKDGVLLK
jgi:hypothetical protein